MEGNGGLSVRAIRKGDLLLIPRVTCVRDGLYRPEVVWSKGRHSDIAIGDVFSSLIRAKCMAELAANAAVATAVGMDLFWRDMDRAVNSTRVIIGELARGIS